jgi:hypothetical protein
MRFFKNTSLKNLVFVIASAGIFQACKTLSSGDRNLDSELSAADPVTKISAADAAERLATRRSKLEASFPVPANDLMIASCVLENDQVTKNTTVEFLDKANKRQAFFLIKMQVLPATNGGDRKIKMTITAEITGANNESGTVILSVNEGNSILELPTGHLAIPTNKSSRLLKLVTDSIAGT